jgi:hypothetical protein
VAEPRSADARLYDLLDEHCVDKTGWGLSPEIWAQKGYRVASPVEPCERCGQKVFLFLVPGWDQPRWLTLGEIKGKDTLYPYSTTRSHRCGDGDSWSVEAAVFVETAMREWALGAAQ